MVRLCFIFSILFLHASFAWSLVTVDTGAKVALATSQTLLAAPPLPVLFGTEGELSVQASYIQADVAGDATLGTGRFTGGALGLGYSSRPHDDLNYFAIVNANVTSGKISGGIVNFSDFKSFGCAFATGLGYKIFGEKDDTFALGIFGGPAALPVSGSFTVQNQKYETSPFIIGALAGAQFRILIGKAFLIPYGLYFQELSGKCKTVTSDSGAPAGSGCGGDANKVSLPASFAAYGFVVGYRDLSLNLYSRMKNTSELSDINVNHLSVSYSF